MRTCSLINEPYPAKEENANIEVFITNLPSEVYIELAQISCNDTVDDWCLKQIKIKAREIGADGIIILGLMSCTPISHQYSSSFRVSGYYICYDSIHYKYVCRTENDVKDIIKYYYPDCFDVVVYYPGTEQTGYLNTIFYATWKSYLDYVEIK